MLCLPSFGFRSIGTGVALTLLILIIYKIITSKLNARKYRTESAQRGCAPAPTLHSNNLLGTSRLKESIKATKEDRGPQYVVSAMNEVGHNIHTVRVPILDYELLVTRDPENVKAMFSTQSGEYDISATRSSAFMPLLGEGIFTSTGQQWKHSRALVRPQFSREEISNLDLVERHVRTLMRVLSVNEKGWTETVDLQPLMFYFTLDTATEFLYGQSVNSQAAIAGLESSKNGIDGAAFSHHFGAAKHLVDKRGALGKFFWLMPMGEMKMHCKAIHEVIDKMISDRLDNKKNPLSMEEKGTRKFVLLDELAKETQDLKELRNETLHTLMAGRDPTGALLGWVWYFLARHPAIFSKLRKIVLNQFGTSASNPITDFGDLRRCDYLQWVIHEVIRIVAIIPMNERVALKDTTLPRGGGEDGSKPIFVRKGIQVLIPLYAIQHRPDIWGQDAEDFRPERWQGRRIGWEWIPFGGGARKCLGQQFAFTEASYCIVRMLQRFDVVENMEGPGEIKLHTAIENRSGTGVKVRFHEVRK
ncbi:cytochrome P450 family protein [Mollisia scopiformis]|uniref:Cytochrome P450 family protein n=1 Tax=Mollisia scopiformis TaxID=149040 RepID=A0A194X0Z2_MOLSC|nr:cytochrome P450 family protein [Mollisia scopiformis]KUJ13532.1 cytochrome P450 family protein [Mollisia scopiformis]